MKFFRFYILLLIIFSLVQSCNSEEKNIWDKEIKNEVQKVEILDISAKLYDKNINVKQFREEFPFFEGDDAFLLQEKPQKEIEIYREAISKMNKVQLEKDLSELFSRIKDYFPKFIVPKVVLYSSGLQYEIEPITYEEKNNLLYIDIVAFMGENNKNYDGIDKYMQKSMNQENILPKISKVFAEHIVAMDRNKNKFIDRLIYEGKLMILQDAFIPKVPEYLKMNYTKEQYEWAITYEKDIWNYFIENNLLFSEDEQLYERFITVAPFSKFYTEIDRESSPQIGIFIGWQLCRIYFKNNPNINLLDFIKKDTEVIFNGSLYKGVR